MAWFTTDEGNHVNTDWFDEDERRKYKQIEENQKQASDKNKSEQKKMTLKTLKYEEKKWAKRQGYAKRNRELENLESGTEFIAEQFGDVSDLIGQVLIRSGAWSGLYDRDGFQGRGRATYFNGGGYISESLVVHEFTHAISSEIASHYKELGFSSEREVFSTIRTEVLTNLSRQERKYDGRKWADRPEEYISRNIEWYGDRKERKRDAIAMNISDFKESPVSAESQETLTVLKKWWKKIGR